MNPGTATIQIVKKTRKEIKKAYESANKYVPKFISPNQKSIHWMKVLFWIQIGIVAVMLALISIGEWA